jgi:hypothetical protein
MSGDDLDVDYSGSRRGSAEGRDKRDKYRARVEELSKLIPEDSLLNGQKFEDLSLYEQKSVLVNHELE